MARMKFLTAALMMTVAAPAGADTICEWMDFAGKVDAAAAPSPAMPRTGEHDRAQTQVALAMFEALNAIDRRFETYLGFPAGNVAASQDAAAATAASSSRGSVRSGGGAWARSWCAGAAWWACRRR